MWWEIVPCFGIIAGAMGLPHISTYLLNKLIIGNNYRRNVSTPQQQMQYIRDRRLTDNPYKLSGLENIPNQ